ncbi:MAG: BlaI/MecI/CopY family transcriptional regulator [Chitinophagaceae bacterium]|nr:MAG: BlaI/MecI/CopY family transcriptional regulator [Chitinophagaceae bacterium]
MDKLTQQEEEAMMVVYKVGEGNVKAFLDDMPEPKPPYTTLASTIKNLEKKGFLKSRLVGNTYLYKPSLDQEVYKQNYMSSVVKNYFANSYKELVNFFVEQKKLSPKELKDIIDMIEGNQKP